MHYAERVLCQISCVATFQLLGETTRVPAVYHLTDGFHWLAPSPRSRLASKRVNCSGSWAKSRVLRFIDWDSLVCPVAVCRDASQTSPSAWRARSRPQPWQKRMQASVYSSGLFQDVEDDALQRKPMTAKSRTATIHIHHTGRHSPEQSCPSA